MRTDEKVGVLGGSFDPVHKGHLAMAEAVRAAHGLDRVLLMPAFQPPHKRPELAPYEHRLEMVRRAAQGLSGIEVSDLEGRRRGVSFTVETLEELRRLLPDAELFLVVGEDSVPDLPGWRNIQRICELARIVAVNRPGFQHGFAALAAAGVPPSAIARCEADRVTMPPDPIASREIRRRLAAGELCDEQLPDGIGAYIRAHELYGSRV